MFGDFQSLKSNPDEHRIQPIEASQLDIAKNVFQLHTVDMSTGEVINLQLKRAKVLKHFANRVPDQQLIERLVSGISAAPGLT